LIAVLHGGQIVELGTHDELLSRNGYYTDLYNKQLLEEELAEVKVAPASRRHSRSHLSPEQQPARTQALHEASRHPRIAGH
jgi:ABC-type multidrug transport system ATPase subunit